ncbi:MAG: HAF repeat-containing protein [Ectothiorhodospiraceae bacterium]|nr:HAF repeat-containing protein [Chromatiales bacterium]MCP5156314.1 HAF repeat-containing protein [Ectothiorhodospiraceae bacterium]
MSEGSRPTRARRLRLLFAVACLSTLTAAQAVPTFRSTDLGALSSIVDESLAWAINDAGQVAGESYTPAGDRRAVRWGPQGLPTDLGDLSGGFDSSLAQGINDLGDVVGAGTTSAGWSAFLWREGSGMQDLGALVGAAGFSAAFGINNIGQVVGSRGIAGTTHAFLWDPAGGVLDLGDLPGGADFSAAYAVNEAGRVVGQAASGDGFRAFIWDETDGMRSMGTLAGGGASAAYAINDLGQAVGDVQFGFGVRAFLWEDGVGMTDLGDLGGPAAGLTRATGINNHGQVVGTSGSSPFLWDATTGMIRLDTLIDPLDPLFGLSLDDAVAINDLGQIIVRGPSPTSNILSHAYLLTPVDIAGVDVPEPIVVMLLVPGLWAAVSRRGRAWRRSRPGDRGDADPPGSAGTRQPSP